MSDTGATGSPHADWTGHGGELIAGALAAWGTEAVFTLSGGHIFPVFDGAVRRDPPIRLIDVRHEQTATFAAEAVSKLTRRPGVAALTAGPGVTNGTSAITGAHINGSPLVVLGGRAPEERWGAGSLQEFDHVPVVAPITKWAATVTETGALANRVDQAMATASTPHRGPVFLDVPLDVIFAQGQAASVTATTPRGPEPDGEEVAAAAQRLAEAERPAIIAGGDVWWDGAEEALVAAAEALRVPVFANGQGRGTIPTSHELAFTRARKALKAEADVVLVAGTPLDFRLGFGSFGDAEVLHAVDHPDRRATHVAPAVAPAGDLATILAAIAEHRGKVTDHQPWIDHLGELEAEARAGDEAMLTADATPILPGRIYGELRRRLDPDAIVICDGGDFVSYAGRFIDSEVPGAWLDPGPFGCLGTSAGYAAGARVTHPDRQIVVLLGDGAAGFSLMDVDTLVRHDLPVVFVCGNNGIWGLEKHPMAMLYGYDVAADLRPGTPYDAIVTALGGAGETVTEPGNIGPALDRAFAAGVPYLVNILTDPADAYPRSSNLG